MPVITTAELVGSSTVRYTWSGDAPFDVWLRGELVARQTTMLEWIAEYYGEDAEPWIEVLDANDVDPAASELYSPRLRLQWRGQADADLYRIERWDGAAWVTAQILRENGRGYYWHLTTPEADGATALWRIVAEDSRGYDGVGVIEVSQVIVCNPETPAVAGAYDAGTGDLTVEAA